MKITIAHVAAHGSIAGAIEAIAHESDTIASGIIGPSFSTSGPGSGWSKQYDVSDYAKRALAGDYGAESYIDSSDGREATLDAEGDIEWSEESVVELILPTVEEALEEPQAWEQMKETAATYGADESEIETLSGLVSTPYQINDGNATEYADTLEEAEGIIEDWYDFLVSDEKLDELPSPDLDSGDIDSLNASIAAWEERIAEAMGKADFAGHGSYHVSAGARAGLNLRIQIRE